jgi:hypothetical protein
MPDVLLTLHCTAADTESIVDALRAVSQAALHIRAESVRGRDFADADPAEQVTATLKRSAIECIEDEGLIETMIGAVGAAKRKSAVRWYVNPVTARGRIA